MLRPGTLIKGVRGRGKDLPDFNLMADNFLKTRGKFSSLYASFILLQLIMIILTAIVVKTLDAIFLKQFFLYGLNFFRGVANKIKGTSSICNIFPTDIFCNHKRVAATGALIFNGGICFVPVNGYYGKYFVAIWSLFALSLPLSIFFLSAELIKIVWVKLCKNPKYSISQSFFLDVMKYDLSRPEYESFFNALEGKMHSSTNIAL